MDNTTAKVSCFARAYHFENNKTHIFDDSMAARLLGDDYDHIAESMMQGINFFLPGFDGTHIGDLCFKGIEAGRNPEIAYSLL